MSIPALAKQPARTALAVAALVCVVTVALGGCGGRSEAKVDADLGSDNELSAVQARMAVPTRAGADSAAPAALQYELVLLNGHVVHQDLDQLDSLQGKGYDALQAFVYVRGRPRATSPLSSVKPVCRTTTSCEYLPARKAGTAEQYLISIDDDSVAELRPVEDTVVILPRQLGLARVTTVNVTLTIPGQQPIVKRIIYGAAIG